MRDACEGGTMRYSARVVRWHRRTAGAIIATCAGLAGGMQRQPVIPRFWRFTECGRVSELGVSGRLLPLHALPRGAELP
jgi:hypothetical protein